MKQIRFLFVLTLMLVSVLAINKTSYAQEVQKEKVYTDADVLPEYPGGIDALIKEIVQNIKYPQKAKEENIQGKVLVQFVVKKDGSVTDVKVLEGIDKACDEEAVRVVKELKQFKPGTKDGKAVAVQMVLPIAFKLS
ncbi:MAG: energy transducer TonB [Ignavibacteriales bacterium]|nr:MAG: energy transducer TonB [Ignavibacteriales bacterium]